MNIYGTIIWGDNHAPFMCKESHNAIYQFAKDKKPKNHIHIGDCLDLYAISRWAVDDYIGMTEQPIREALLQLGRHFNMLFKINPKSDIYWIIGNHEERIDKFVRKNPGWNGMLDDILGLLEYYGKCPNARNIKLIKHEYPDDDFAVGKMHFCHGYYTSKHVAAKHVEEFEENICFGHAHTMQMFAKSRKGHAKAGYCVGHLMSREGAKYGKGSPNRWVKGFGYMEHIEPSGLYTMHLLPIVDGKFIFNGKIYNGNKKKTTRL